MTTWAKRSIIILVITGVISGLVYIVFNQIQQSTNLVKKRNGVMPIPVHVAEIKKGPISLKRTFSGTLEPQSKFTVAPKISGRINRLYVDISETVMRNQVVAELDNEEYIQEVAQAKASLAVENANLKEAINALSIANRELKRIKTLNKKGIESVSQLDSAKTNQLEKEAQVEIAKAQRMMAESALEASNIRLNYTKVIAQWSDDDKSRIVAERFIDEGNTVSAATPLISIIKLNPIIGVIYITEKDYSYLKIDQNVQITTDTFPKELFVGKVSRISPIFKKETRQVRIELLIDNQEHKLKPGMFIRATIVLKHIEEATIIPDIAITKRDDQTGVFVVINKDNSVFWNKVDIGIKDNTFVQVSGLNDNGSVVTLGHQLLKNGSKISIPEKFNENPSRSSQ
ncbi:efflux transporter, RND family, MFP subunit [Candidatus Magnetomorum sp. HK-1]|nr:efflux transporter, RND family, MFP subunit [Candidatus Magnetomorum sp. HK-1]